MKFRYRDNLTVENEFPRNIHEWINGYDKNIDVWFSVDLTEELPGEAFGFIDCLVSRAKGLGLLKGFQSKYVNNEGNAGYVIRDSNNIFSSDEEIYFKTIPTAKEFWSYPKYNWMLMDKAISTVEYFVKNQSFSNDVRFDRWWDLNKW